MKKILGLLLIALLLPHWVFAQDGGDGRFGRDDRDGKGGHRGHGHPRPYNVRPNIAGHSAAVHANGYAHGPVAPQFRSMGIHSYPKPFARGKLMPNGRFHEFAMPNRGPNGVGLHATVFSRTNFSGNPVIQAHMNIVAGAAFHSNLVSFSVHETIPNHYYWHTYGGFNYCHYYFGGYHWYGWYLGNSYFWTRWWGNHYWWYDPVYFRWCYWHDGGWWWQDPDTTTIYVYNNGNYVSSTGASTSAQTPSSNVKSADFFSPNSTREVRVLAGGDAFLYDISGANAFKPIYLSSNVADVKFSNTSNGGGLQIMLILKDGTFSTYDAQGNSLSGNGSSNAAPMNDDYSAPSQSAPAPGNGAPQPPPSGANPPSASSGTNS